MRIAGTILTTDEVNRIAETDPVCVQNHRATVAHRDPHHERFPKPRITQRTMHLLLIWQKRAAVRRHLDRNRASWNAAHGRNFNSVGEALSTFRRAA